jgi:hypothetical protein
VKKVKGEIMRLLRRTGPPWAIRLFNAAAGLSERLGLPQAALDERQLLDAACRDANLTDFGEYDFSEPLRILLHDYETQSALTPFGRMLVRLSLRSLLSNRLRIQDQLKSHPEILDWPIRRPLFVLGLPRTGTTLLYNLLAQDPEARPLRTWEAVAPAPRRGESGRQPDPRIRRTVGVVRLIRWLAPRLQSVHPIHAEGPEECSRLLMNTFVTAYALMENHVPGYRDWFFGLPPERLELAYRDYARQLQVLQWQHAPRGHWLLKSPVHLFALEALMNVFPDAAIVQLHRDPRRVVPSLCSLFAVYQGMASDRDRSRQLGAEILSLCAEGVRRADRAREAAPPGRILDLDYAQLMADPMAAIREVYESLNYPFTDEFNHRARQWHQANPQHKHGKHRYRLEQFGLTEEQIDRQFEPYCRARGIEPEDGRPWRQHQQAGTCRTTDC